MRRLFVVLFMLLPFFASLPISAQDVSGQAISEQSISSQPISTKTFDHRIWDQLLKQHVVAINGDSSTAVDYAAFQKEKKTLQSYLSQLTDVTSKQFDAWPKLDQLAFLINAYNAWTVALILTEYPELESIKDLGSIFKSPWKKKFISVLGETRSLDDIEHRLIRGSGRYNEPRIHFAVNCASVGCPALRSEAYRGDMIEEQLEAATVSFLSDSSRNRVEGDAVQLSSIFKWYREDFESDWRGAKNLSEFLSLYKNALGLSLDEEEKLNENSMDIDFLDYDWDLNSLPPISK